MLLSVWHGIIIYKPSAGAILKERKRTMRKLNKISLRALSLLLVMALLLSLFGCGKGTEPPDTVQDGIVISPEAPYSEETVLYAEETLYPLILRFAKNRGLFLTQSMKTHYRGVAAEVAAITAASPVAESLYISAMDAIRAHGEAVVDELCAYMDGEGGALTETAALYRSLVSLFDSEAVLTVFYDLLLYSYDYRYKDAMEKYVQYGNRKFKQQAEDLQAEKRVITDEIGKDAFCMTVGQTLALTDLLVGGALESEQFDTFSNEELLAFVRRLEIRPLTIGDKGWELLLGKAAPAKQNDAESYAMKLLACAKSEGDIPAIAGVCNDLSAVGAAVISHLSAAEIALLRAGNYEGALSAVLSRFSDAEWECLKRVRGVSLDSEAYHAVALKVYGDPYAAYSESLVPLTAEELRDRIGTENFYESLERFVGGISPAFSYGMKK